MEIVETRCKHDILIFNGRHTCSWCQGLPDNGKVDNDPAIDATTGWMTGLSLQYGFRMLHGEAA